MKRLPVFVLLFAALSTLPGWAADQKPAISDDRIIDQIRMRLTTDQDVKGGADDVTVHDGAVTIKGRVDSDRGKTKATKLAKKVKGVKSVDNQLSVGPPN